MGSGAAAVYPAARVGARWIEGRAAGWPCAAGLAALLGLLGLVAPRAPVAQEIPPLAGVVELAAGVRHACALVESGAVLCWGDNRFGQLGDGSTTARPLPVRVLGLEREVVAIGAGDHHSCAVLRSGDVRCWGANAGGQLGDGSRSDRSVPAVVGGLPARATAVAGGREHSCALLASGQLACWGENASGQLGIGGGPGRPTATLVVGLAGSVREVDLGEAHGCALLQGGSVQCWGAGLAGQLGDGGRSNRNTPTAVAGLSGGVLDVAVGAQHGCAVRGDGGVVCWGANAEFGQLGDGSLQDQASPVLVPGLGGAARAVAAGGSHSCAVLTTGAVRCWGRNNLGQLGNGRTAFFELAPVAVAELDGPVLSLALSGAEDVFFDGFSCAVLASGKAVCWGYNGVGQLGEGSVLARTTPTEVVDLGPGVAEVGVGGYHTCARNEAGAVSCWGANFVGQLGDGTVIDRPRAVPVNGLGAGVRQLAIGFRHSCALLPSGGVRCWGENRFGQVGNGAVALSQPVPVDVQGLAGPVARLSAGYDHTCALLVAGGLQCWGSNAFGQLGDGSRNDRPSAGAVQGLGGNVAAFSAGGRHSCVVLASGAARCWGWNNVGQLGNGGQEDALLPTDVSGLGAGVAGISAGFTHSCAVLASGEVRCWGNNAAGQLGDGTAVPRSTPVSVLGLPGPAASVSAGAAIYPDAQGNVVFGGPSCALLRSGASHCWGINVEGQLGDGTLSERRGARPVSGLGGDTRQLATGGHHSCALRGAALLCWGSDAYGQIGDGGRNTALAGAVRFDPTQAALASASAGGDGNSNAVSSDALGRYLAFASTASNLTAGDRNAASDIFRRDTRDGSLLRLSVGNDGSEIAGPSIEPTLSADGSVAVFVAPDAAVGALAGESAKAAIQRQAGGGFGVYLRNIVTGTTRRLGPGLPEGAGTRPHLAAQAGGVAYTALAPAGQPGAGKPQVFLVRLVRSGSERVPEPPRCLTCDAAGKQSEGSSGGVLSADAEWLAFASSSGALAASPSRCSAASSHVYLRNVLTGSTRLLSDPANAARCSPAGSGKPSIDWSGLRVAFETAHGLQDGDANGHADVYVIERDGGTARRVSSDPRTGHDGLAPAGTPILSGDGLVVAFLSDATNLESSEPDDNETNDVFVRHLGSGAMRRVSRNARGDQAEMPSGDPALSFDGAQVAFASAAANLQLNPLTGRSSDGNRASDVFQAGNPLVAPNKSATWWIPGESGWGLITVDQGEALGVGWFTYDADGEPTWFIGAALPRPDGSFGGEMARQTGVPLQDTDGLTTLSSTKLADFTLRFEGSGAVRFDYAVAGGPAQRKDLRRFLFAGEDVVCHTSPEVSRAAAGNLSDVWWGGEGNSGWGLFVSQTRSLLLATWYTFDADGEAVFLSIVAEPRPDGSFAGPIFRQRDGTPFTRIDGAPPSTAASAVGEASFRLRDGERVDFTYRLGGIERTRTIRRFVFGARPGVCDSRVP